MWNYFRGKFLLSIVMCALVMGVAQAKAPTLYEFEQQWDAVLSDSVSAGQRNGIFLHFVDYETVSSHNQYAAVLTTLKAFDLTVLTSTEAKLSFWINAYNVAAIKTIVDYDPHYSIRDIGNVFRPVWKLEVLEIGHDKYSMYEIEHEILREMGEPRIHFALNCASLSCPNLRMDAYTAANIDDELAQQTLAFLADPIKGLRLSSNGRSVLVSMIFKWFKDDFEPHGGVRGFLDQYSSQDLSDVILGYLDYDWSVNRYEE